MSTSTTNRGKSLETTILASQGTVVRVHKMTAGAKWIGKGRTIPVQGPVDFVGTVVGTGRSICFDAKTCDLVHRFPVGHRDHFSEHQRQYLIEQGTAGAVSGLIVESTRLRKFYWLNWRDIPAEEPSLPWTDPRLVEIGSSLFTINFRAIPGVTPPCPSNAV